MLNNDTASCLRADSILAAEARRRAEAEREYDRIVAQRVTERNVCSSLPDEIMQIYFNLQSNIKTRTKEEIKVQVVEETKRSFRLED
jgi:hypothetical protein